MYFETYDWDIDTSPSLVTEMFERFIWHKLENDVYVTMYKTELNFQKQFELTLIKLSMKFDAFENLSLIALNDSVNTDKPIMFHCRYFIITNLLNGDMIKTRDTWSDLRSETFMNRNMEDILNIKKNQTDELTVAFMISVEIWATVTENYRVTSLDDSNVTSTNDEKFNDERTLWTKEVVPIGYILSEWIWI
jgi:hypothetical protein